MFSFSKLFKKDAPIESMDDALGIDGGEAVSKPCETCRWWNPDHPTVCDAFEEGIPLPIFFGYLDHTVPFDDEDLLYEKSLSARIKKDGENYKGPKTSVAEASAGEGGFEELHPRYPKGSPKAGKFMPKGSPEYNAARKASLERFHPAKYAVGRKSGANADDYAKKSEIKKLRQGYQIAKKLLTPEEMDEFNKVSAECTQDRLDGKESYKQHTIPNPENPKERKYTPERLAVHNEILDKMFKNAANFKPEAGQKPDFIILGGTGGAGKTAFSKGDSKVFDESKYLKLDSDEIKEQIPGYNPQKAYLSHVESGDILDKALARAKAMGLNTVLDATMRNSAKDDFMPFKEAGYTMQAHYMHISPAESAGRALLRWKGKVGEDGKVKRGRLVPPEVILGMVNNLNNFKEAADHADKWSFNRNNVPKGAAPIRVISKD